MMAPSNSNIQIIAILFLYISHTYIYTHVHHNVERNPYPPPNNVHVIDIHQYAFTGQLTFNWSSVTAFCPSAYSVITNINCGDCPTSTRNNQVTCENVALGHTCSFVVSTVVCGNITGNPSNSISVVLKGELA